MTEITVEGYKVVVEKQPEGNYVASVPELPGCSVQVEDKADVEREIKVAIGAYLLELSSKKPKGSPGFQDTARRKLRVIK